MGPVSYYTVTQMKLKLKVNFYSVLSSSHEIISNTLLSCHTQSKRTVYRL